MDIIGDTDPMQHQFIFGHGDTDPDLSVPMVVDAEDVDVVRGFGNLWYLLGGR